VNGKNNMNLPELPKKYKRREANIDGKVLDWFLENYDGDVAIEVKIKGNYALEHQEIALSQVNNGKFKFKIPDMGRRNPFDGIVLKKAEGFLVTCDGKNCIAVSDKKTFSFKIK
jgi:hypothetical protein